MEVVTLRPAASQDYGFLYDLHCAALKEYITKTWGWDEEWQEQRFRTQFDDFRDCARIVQLGAEAIGAFAFDDKGDHIFLAYIALLPKYQRHGIGSRLIESVIEKARKLGKPVHLHVLKTNPARELYRRFGFLTTDETATHFVMAWSPAESQGSDSHPETADR